MHRRTMLASLAAAAAAPSLALADDTQLPLAKAFPFLDRFLELPPGAHSRVYLAYRATRNNRPAPDARAAIVWPGGAKTQLEFAPGGQVAQLPTLAQLKSGAILLLESAPFHLTLELRSAIAPSTRIDAGEVSAGLAQVNTAVAHLAGVLAAIAPKLTAAYFPDAGGGRVVLADGRTAPLPVLAVPYIGQVPYFEPSAFAGAKSLVLTRTPSRIVLAGHPKTA